MSRWFVLAPGPSMSQELADRVRGENVVVVNNAYELAPWAAALVANDLRWWKSHPEAMRFAGRKFCTKTLSGVDRHRGPGVGADSNSGMLGIDVALRVFGATEILLLGFDFHGTHFFGRYENGCSNTTPSSRIRHAGQMRTWKRLHPEAAVVNLTPGSALDVFPMGELDDYQGSGPVPAAAA